MNIEREILAYIAGFAAGAHLPFGEARNVATIPPELPYSDFQLKSHALGFKHGQAYLLEHPNNNVFFIVWTSISPSASVGQIHTYAASEQEARQVAEVVIASDTYEDEDGTQWTTKITEVTTPFAKKVS